MKKILCLFFCFMILMTSCVDDKRYYEEGYEDGIAQKKNQILYLFNSNYKQGFREGDEIAIKKLEFEKKVKETGDSFQQFTTEVQKSFDRFWKDLNKAK